MKELKRDLEGSTSDAQPPIAEVTIDESEPAADDLDRVEPRDDLLTVVVDRTRGKHAPFMTDRTDEQLRGEPIERLELAALDWVETEPRRLAAEAEAISSVATTSCSRRRASSITRRIGRLPGRAAGPACRTCGRIAVVPPPAFPR